MPISVRPQVLFNISTHTLANQVNQIAQGTVFLGILLGTEHPRSHTIEIVDSFEMQYNSQELLSASDTLYLKERLELRLRGDQWNLFRNLDVVGNEFFVWQDGPTPMDIKLHEQILNVVQDQAQEGQVNTFRYALFFSNKRERVYQLSGNTLVETEHRLEPSEQEMIAINSVKSKSTSKSPIVDGLQDQLNTIKQFEWVLCDILNSLDHPSIQNDPLLLRDINQVLNSMPQQLTGQKETVISEFQKVVQSLQHLDQSNQLDMSPLIHPRKDVRNKEN